MSSHDETWKEMVQDKKRLSSKLVEMGFDRDSFLVVRDYDNIKVGDSYDDKRQLKDDPYLSFGGAHHAPDKEE